MQDIIGYRPLQQVEKKPKRFRKRSLLILAGFSALLFITQGPATIDALTVPTPTVSAAKEIRPIADSYIAVKESASRPLIYAKHYILIDAQTGEVIIEKDSREPVAVASTTKMVTALVARELFELDEVVDIGPFPASRPGSRANLRSGSQMTVESLIKGIMLQSGNDAAFALAEHYSEDYKDFLGKMNQYTSRYGLKNSVFADPAGLNDDGRSTAWELAQIGRLVMRDNFLSKVVKLPLDTIYSVAGTAHEIRNTNRLLVPDSSFFMSGVSGIKTGFTLEAGYCLVSSYESSAGPLIAVVLNTAEFTTSAPLTETRKLFNWAEMSLERRSY